MAGDRMNDTVEVLPPPTSVAIVKLEQGGSSETHRPASSLVLGQLPVDDPLYETAQSTAKFVQASKAEATINAYKSDWRHFREWCQKNRLASLPAESATVALYDLALRMRTPYALGLRG